MDNIQEKMEIQYIPKRSPNPPYTQNRTKRNKERFEFIQARRGLYSLRRVQTTQAQHQDYRSQVYRQSQPNTSTLDFIDPEANEEVDGLPPSQTQGDYSLPPLTKKPRKDNGLQIHPRGVVETIEGSQVRNTSRSGREILELWRDKDI